MELRVVGYFQLCLDLHAVIVGVLVFGCLTFELLLGGLPNHSFISI
jgi:hypothetical protein